MSMKHNVALTSAQRALVKAMDPRGKYSYDQLGALSGAGQGLGSMVDSLERKGMIEVDGKREALRAGTIAGRRAAYRFSLTAKAKEIRSKLKKEA